MVETELGVFDLPPLHVGLIPRGVRFRVSLPDGRARGYVAENYGSLFRLPHLGPIGANGLANPRDFETPVARFYCDAKVLEIGEGTNEIQRLVIARELGC